MSNKEKLMRQIQICDFLLLDTALFLDTHKNDKAALAFYKKHLAMAKAYRNEYVEKFGPLLISDSDCDSSWEWVASKWPWEYDANCGKMGV